VVVDAYSARTGGGISYLAGLLPRLVREPGVASVAAFLQPGAELAAALADSGVELRERALKPRGLAGRALWEATALARIAPHSVVLTPSAILPRGLPGPVVAVPQNILPFVGAGGSNAVRRAAILRTLRSATGVIFLSAEMRRQVRRRTQSPILERVIPCGLDDAFLAPGTSGPRNEIVSVLDPSPHKRLGLLLDAWRLLGADRPPLRVIGSSVPAVPGVRCEQGLAAREVARAMQAARLVVLTSAAESFGLPALEALGCGAPVVASDLPALREVTGGHARYVAGEHPRTWAAAIGAALDAPGDPEPGRGWAHDFTWERAAAATAELLLEARMSYPG
jgi:glycosyltransferase involved in cell wall biosynthesis